MDYPSMIMGRKTASLAISVLLLVVGFAAGLATPWSLVRSGDAATVTETTVVTRIDTITRTVAGMASTVTVRVPTTVTATITATRIPVPDVPLRLEVKYSRLFEITVLEGFKVVRDALNRTLVLVPRGAQPPSWAAGKVVVYTPVERVVLMSATQVALIERLREKNPGILEGVAGIMWGQQYEWYFAEVASRLASGAIRDVGPDYQPSLEEIVKLKPDLIIIYTYPGSDIPARLEELGLVYVVDNEYLEDNPLGRFEWIKLVATFFEMDKAAYEIFGLVEESILDVAEKVAAAQAPRPKVCWFMVYRGTFYVAGGRSFPANTLSMLKASYGFADTASTGSIVSNVEEVLSRCSDADVVIYPTSFVSGIGDILAEAPDLAGVKAFRTQRVYGYAPTVYQLGYYDTEGWFRDLAALLYPELFDGEKLDYFTRLSG
jgi:iron complex transport system substrate-binding protein